MPRLIILTLNCPTQAVGVAPGAGLAGALPDGAGVVVAGLGCLGE